MSSIYDTDLEDLLSSSSAITPIPNYKSPDVTLEGDDSIFKSDEQGNDEYAHVRDKTIGNIIPSASAELTDEDIRKRRQLRARVIVSLTSRVIVLGFRIAYKKMVAGSYLNKVRNAIAILSEKKNNGGLSESEKDDLIELQELKERLVQKERKFEDNLKHKPDQLEVFTEGLLAYMEAKNINPSDNNTLMMSAVELIVYPLIDLLQEAFFGDVGAEEKMFNYKYQKYIYV